MAICHDIWRDRTIFGEDPLLYIMIYICLSYIFSFHSRQADVRGQKKHLYFKYNTLQLHRNCVQSYSQLKYGEIMSAEVI